MVQLLPCRRMAIVVNGRSANRNSGTGRARRAGDSPLLFPSCNSMFSTGAAQMASGHLRNAEGKPLLPEAAVNPPKPSVAAPASVQADRCKSHRPERYHHGAFGCMPCPLMGASIPTSAGHAHEVRAAISANASFLWLLSLCLSKRKRARPRQNSLIQRARCV